MTSEEINPSARGRSRKGAWIEMQIDLNNSSKSLCRSRKGAWIEISQLQFYLQPAPVAPVRERGLKSQHMSDQRAKAGRSRKGAWIEIHILDIKSLNIEVAPVRERGLKYQSITIMGLPLPSLP